MFCPILLKMQKQCGAQLNMKLDLVDLTLAGLNPYHLHMKNIHAKS